jgi:Na+-transporting methylmalonyl-CoA/oxaloacetate decarboxylase gamma subunit
MLKLSLIFLAFIALFVLLLRAAVIFMGRISGKYVGEKHKAAETIINTGKPPTTWTCNSAKKMAELKEDSTGPRAVKIEKKARNTCLKRLEGLIKYFKTSPLCQDEETRKILLDELSKVRRVWQEKDWGEIIVSKPTPPSLQT